MSKSKSKVKVKPKAVKPVRWQPKELNRAKSWLDKGLTVQQVADKLNRSKGSVQTAISRHALRD